MKMKCRAIAASVLCAAAFCPISDLARWHVESKTRGNHYADNIAKCCGLRSSKPAMPGTVPLDFLSRQRRGRPADFTLPAAVADAEIESITK